MKAILSVSRQTNTGVDYWLSMTVTEFARWVDALVEVHKEEK